MVTWGPPVNPGHRPHLKILNLSSFAKSSFPYKVTGSGIRTRTSQGVSGEEGCDSVNHTQVPSFKVLSPGVSRTVLKFFSSHRETRSSPSTPALEAPGAPLRWVAEMLKGLQTFQLLLQSLEPTALRRTPPLAASLPPSLSVLTTTL